MNTSDKADLLIVACSARKKQSSDFLPAIELYDGSAFRILRKQLKTSEKQPTIWILSAKHGLVEAFTPLRRYDVRMTQQRAQDVGLQVRSFIDQFAPPGKFHKIFVWAGRLYLFALPPSFLAREEVQIAHGPIGQKLRLLKEWCSQWK